MAKDYAYLFSQLRRIEDHREQQAEKEIRKLYKKILKETRQFIAEEYYQFAEDGKLTFEILRSKSMDARFLQEVEERLGGLSIDVSREIKRTVEEMYQLSYDGLRNAVEKGKDSKALQDFFQGVDTTTAQTAWANVDNTIMDIALEKNHKNIIWDIKREVATALTVGDRFDTMADRIAGKLNGNYKKAILIARTEVGRVREAGHLASAKNLNDALENGSSGMRMVKKWMTMRDGSVRDTHSRMNGVVVEMDDPFILPSEVKTMAPKQSGVASEDCNCRCYVSYQLMDDEEFFKATGKHFKNFHQEKDETGDIVARNKFGDVITFDEQLNSEKWSDSVRYIKELANEYDTRLVAVKVGVHQAAGSVDMGGTMRLSSKAPNIAFHEFAHSIAMESLTKYGVVDDSAFWKEIKSVRRAYKKEVGDDVKRWISSYEQSNRSVGEFFAEAFAQAKMSERGIPIPDKYGSDLTYSNKVLAITDKYFKKPLEKDDTSDKMSIGIQFFANKSIQKQTSNQLVKSVSSWKKNVELHKDKIEHPERYDTGWESKTEKQKQGLIKHWEKEIKNFKSNIDDAEAELEARVREK